jgi:hypothetical protein
MYTLRHNKLCGVGCKFIRRGKLGASVVSQDIGRHNAADTPEEQARLGTRIGGRIWTPRKLTDAERERLDRFRPDIFIQHDMTTFHIVELKCCKDTAPEKQRQKAMNQHKELVAELRSLFGGQPITVLIHPIMIGVTGTIYNEFYDTMDLLGVSKAEAKRCAAAMHIIAVSYVDTITTTKWQQERRGVG